MRHREELIDFVKKNRGLKEPSVSTSMFKCNLEQDELDEEYMGLYTHGQMLIVPIYVQIEYNYCDSYAFKFELGCNLEILLIEMRRVTGQEIAEPVIWQAKEVPASRVKARCAQLPIIRHRLWEVLKTVEERRERRMVDTLTKCILLTRSLQECVRGGRVYT